MGLLDQLFAQNGYGLLGQNYPSTIFAQPEEAQAAREAAATTLARRFGRRAPQEEQLTPPSVFDAGGARTPLAGAGIYGLNPNAFTPTPQTPSATIPGGLSAPMTPASAAPTSVAAAPPAQQEEPSGYINVGNYRMPQFGPRELYTPQAAQLPVNARPTQGQLSPQPSAGLPSFMPQNGSFLDRLNAGFQSIGNGGSLLGALTGNYTDPLTTQRQAQRAIYNSALQAGLDQNKALLVATNPKALEAYTQQLFPKPEKLAAGETLVSIGGGGPATTLATGGPEKPPAGYDYVDPKDPSKGLQAVPGGPATHLPAETAGRIAMMETAAAGIPDARKVLMQGRGPSGTGLSGAAAAYANSGETGRAQRTVRTAIEGALRAMTGAAAPEVEVTRYENMFMPGPFDSRETATQKLNQLEDFISNARRLVTQGRGPAGNAPASRASDPLGIR